MPKCCLMHLFDHSCNLSSVNPFYLLYSLFIHKLLFSSTELLTFESPWWVWRSGATLINVQSHRILSPPCTSSWTGGKSSCCPRDLTITLSSSGETLNPNLNQKRIVLYSEQYGSCLAGSEMVALAKKTNMATTFIVLQDFPLEINMLSQRLVI